MSESLNKNLAMRWKNIRCFAAIIRSEPAVRTAFDGQGILAWWWFLVLRLHGKPVQTSFPSEHRGHCVADGFRFYGWLYRGLAIILGLTAAYCWVGNLAASFWILGLIASSCYLWITAGLAFTGATRFDRSAGEQIWHLVAFLFFVSIFLACALISISLEMQIAGWLSDALNFTVTLGALSLGVGSYVVELAALVAREPSQKGRIT